MTYTLKEAVRELGMLEYNKSVVQLDPGFISEENLRHIRMLLPFTVGSAATSVFGE